MARSYLCVGGPKAGQRVAVREGVRIIRVPIAPKIAHAVDPNTEDQLKIEVVEYREQTLVGDELAGGYESVTVWAPTTQGPRQTLELLLEAYEKTRREP
jgi:hypothetical protein